MGIAKQDRGFFLMMQMIAALHTFGYPIQVFLRFAGCGQYLLAFHLQRRPDQLHICPGLVGQGVNGRKLLFQAVHLAKVGFTRRVLPVGYYPSGVYLAG